MRPSAILMTGVRATVPVDNPSKRGSCSGNNDAENNWAAPSIRLGLDLKADEEERTAFEGCWRNLARTRSKASRTRPDQREMAGTAVAGCSPKVVWIAP